MLKRMSLFFVMITILLTACAAPQMNVPARPAVQPTVTQAPTLPTVEPTRAAVEPQPTSESLPVTGAQPTPTTSTQPEAVVNVDGLNLRYGPGLNFRIRLVLNQGQKVRLEGRSRDGEWVVARLEDGSAGWVFGAYLQTGAAIAALPVVNAAGGPETVPQPETQPAPVTLPGKYTLYMTISDNIATVSLNKFPANSEISIRLSARGGSPAMTVATGKTDDSGAASVTFEMPRYWSDGSRITQTALRLTVTTADGSVTRSANVVYYQAE